MRPIIVIPPRCSGWRLWKMLNESCGMTREEYCEAFDRRNIEDEDFQIPDGAVVVVLGDEIRRHFRLERSLIHPRVRDGVCYRQVPLPSGSNPFYNDPLARRLVAMMLEDLCQRS
ncbi:MAG TPA: hypothetical protein VK575_01150 [Gemmatimonadaceae bacterium]|jgi:hypothetical protein|nr:hypothetical protein [Gemmatimonadaceae bacterium]